MRISTRFRLIHCPNQTTAVDFDAIKAYQREEWTEVYIHVTLLSSYRRNMLKYRSIASFNESKGG